jgi:hypothetical protein
MNLSRFYASGQIEYCRNFIFKRNFSIRKIFERSCEIGLWRLTANRISELFGVRLILSCFAIRDQQRRAQTTVRATARVVTLAVVLLCPFP